MMKLAVALVLLVVVPGVIAILRVVIDAMRDNGEESE